MICTPETDWELWGGEPEELLVDDPDEVSWLAELLHHVPVHGRSSLPLPQWAGKSKDKERRR